MTQTDRKREREKEEERERDSLKEYIYSKLHSSTSPFTLARSSLIIEIYMYNFCEIYT